MESNIPPRIVSAMLAPHGVREIQSMPPGMSGAAVFRCLGSGGQPMALKRWPEGTPRQRVQEVHRVIRHVNVAGCELVPSLMSMAVAGSMCTSVDDGVCHWELSRWMPGQAAAVNASLEEIRSGAEAISQFHAASGSLGVTHQAPPAVLARLKRLSELDSLIPQLSSSIDLEIELVDQVHQACHLLRWNWNEVRTSISRSLNKYIDREVPTQHVLRDCHRGHVLFVEQKASALIDFDAVRIDTPVLDLSRWVGSFLVDRQDSDQVWEAAMTGFDPPSRLNHKLGAEFQRELAMDLCSATHWIALANWMVWVVLERRRFAAGPAAVAARLRELIAAVRLPA